jgi:hypothetical protein
LPGPASYSRTFDIAQFGPSSTVSVWVMRTKLAQKRGE